MDLSQHILELTNTYEREIIELRHSLHAHPELSFQEINTSKRVKEILESMGLTVKSGIAKTGLIADLNGRNPGKAVILRADMDALPLQEETELPFKSRIDGVMHACGHDVHTANLIGVAKVLHALKDRWDGMIRFVFQPAEEKGGGGRVMIREGILDDVKFDACFALHTLATASPGDIMIGWKNITADSDRFNIRVIGKKAHTSRPQKGVDAIAIAGQIIVALNGVLAKDIDPTDRATFSIGSIHGGTAPNILASDVEMVGMMRNTDMQTRAVMIERIRAIATGIAAAMGGKAEFDLVEGYASVYNDAGLTDFVFEHIGQHIEMWMADIAPDIKAPSQCLKVQDAPMLGAEDFGFFSQKVPSCFYRVGTGDTAPAHNGKFMVEERFIKLCTRSMASIVLAFLNRP